jgi:hypothetical protein
MTDSTETERYADEVQRKMEEKETDELVRIWQENDREAWTDEAFEVVSRILLARLGKLPEQNPPDEDGDESEEEISADEHLIIPFPQDKKLIWIADISNRLSWVILLVGILEAAVRLISDIRSVMAAGSFIEILVTVLGALSSALFYAFVYIVMQAITEIIYLVLDIRELAQPQDQAATIGAI